MMLAATIATGGCGKSAGDSRPQAERIAMTGLVARYYAAAAADDGAAACSMLYSVFEETIAPDYGEPPGPPSLRSRTCAGVLTKLFRLIPGQPPASLARTRVIGVRLAGRRGEVLVRSPTLPAGEIAIRLEHSVWRVAALSAMACGDCTVSASEIAASRRAEAAAAGLANNSQPPADDAIAPTDAIVLSGPRHDDAADLDEDPHSHDDERVLNYGHRAGAGARRVIAALLARYYRLAQAGDGARACPLLYSLLAESLPEEDRSTVRGGPVTCASTLSALFARERARLTADARTLRIVDVRIGGARAYALLSFGLAPPAYTTLHRDAGPWRIDQVFDTGLP